MRATDQAAAGKSLTPPLARAQEPETPDRLEILDAPGVPMRDTHLRDMNLRGWNTGVAIMARNGTCRYPGKERYPLNAHRTPLAAVVFRSRA